MADGSLPTNFRQNVDAVKSSIETAILANEIPVLGVALSGAEAQVFAFVDGLAGQVEAALIQHLNDGAQAGLAAAATALNQIGGVSASVSGSVLTFTLGATQNFNLFALAGSPHLGLRSGNVEISSEFDLVAAAALNLTFAFDASTQILTIVPTADQFSLGLEGTADIAANADFGLIGLTVLDSLAPSDEEVDLTFALSVDNTGAATAATIDGSTRFAANLQAEIPFAGAPQFGTDVALIANFDNVNLLPSGAGPSTLGGLSAEGTFSRAPGDLPDIPALYQNIDLTIGGVATAYNGAEGAIDSVLSALVGGVDLEALEAQFGGALTALMQTLEARINDALFGTALPLLESELQTRTDQLTTLIDTTIARVQTELTDLIDEGKAVALSTIAARLDGLQFVEARVVDGTNTLTVTFNPSGTLDLDPLTVPANLGLPGLNLTTDGTIDLKADAAFQLGVLFDTETAVLTLVQDSSNTLDLGLTGVLRSNVQGQFSTVTVGVTDKIDVDFGDDFSVTPPEVDLDFALDLNTDLSIAAATASGLVQFDLGLKAGAALSSDPDAAGASINTDVSYTNSFGSTDLLSSPDLIGTGTLEIGEATVTIANLENAVDDLIDGFVGTAELFRLFPGFAEIVGSFLGNFKNELAEKLSPDGLPIIDNDISVSLAEALGAISDLASDITGALSVIGSAAQTAALLTLAERLNMIDEDLPEADRRIFATVINDTTLSVRLTDDKEFGPRTLGAGVATSIPGVGLSFDTSLEVQARTGFDLTLLFDADDLSLRLAADPNVDEFFFDIDGVLTASGSGKVGLASVTVADNNATTLADLADPLSTATPELELDFSVNLQNNSILAGGADVLVPEATVTGRALIDLDLIGSLTLDPGDDPLLTATSTFTLDAAFAGVNLLNPSAIDFFAGASISLSDPTISTPLDTLADVRDGLQDGYRNALDNLGVTDVAPGLAALLTAFFDNFIELTEAKLAAQNLPILGDKLSVTGSEVAAFLTTVLTDTTGALSAVGTVAGQAALLTVSNTLDALDYITSTVDDVNDPTQMMFTFDRDESITLAAVDLGQLGLSAGGFSLDGQFNLQALAEFGVSFVYDLPTNTLTFDTSAAAGDEIRLAIEGFLQADGTGNLGFLSLDVQDNFGLADPITGEVAPELDLEFTVNLTDDDRVVDVELTGSANVNVSVEAGIAGTGPVASLIPSLSTDVVLSAAFAATDLVANPDLSGDFAFALEDITVEFAGIASFFDGVFGQVLEFLETPPFKQIIDLFVEPFPILDDAVNSSGQKIFDRHGARDGNGDPAPDGTVTLLDFVPSTSPAFEFFDTFAGVVSFVRIMQSINNLQGELNLGSLSLTGDSTGIFSSGVPFSVDDLFALNGALPTLPSLNPVTAFAEAAGQSLPADLADFDIDAFITGVGAAQGPLNFNGEQALAGASNGAGPISIPLLEDPIGTAIALLLNGFGAAPVTLVEIDLPRFEFSTEITPPPIVFAPVPLFVGFTGALGAAIDLTVGFDTAAFADGFSLGEGNFDFFDGLFLRTDQKLDDNGRPIFENGVPQYEPFAEAFFQVAVQAGIEVALARLFAEGGVRGEIEIGLPGNSPDGKTRLSDISLPALFQNISGRVIAFLDIVAEFGIGPFTVEKRANLGKFVIVEFGAANPPGTDFNLADEENDILVLNVGDRASSRNLGDLDQDFVGNKPGTNEVFTIGGNQSGRGGDADPDNIFVTGFNRSSVFDAKTLGFSLIDGISADAGSGDDALLVDPSLQKSTTLRGGAGADILVGGASTDLLDGGSENDILRGNGGNDTIVGGSGKDSVLGGAGADDLDGGADDDLLSYQDASSSIAIAAVLDGITEILVGTVGFASGDVARNFERIEGSGFGDTVTGYTSRSNQIDGDKGDDSISGGAMQDLLIGGEGADTLDGAGGLNDIAVYTLSFSAVRVDLTAGSGVGGEAEGDVLTGIEYLSLTRDADFGRGNAVANRIEGLEGNDTLFGEGGQDTLLGQHGDDIIDGGSGDDTVDGAGGDNTLRGGAGNDLIEVNVIATPVVTSGDAEPLQDAIGANVIDGGDGADTLVAGELADTIFGGAGDDQISAGEGANRIDAGAGNDTVSAGSANDVIDGGAGTDQIIAGSGDDSISGGEGADSIEAGAGVDTVSYTSSATGVVLNVGVSNARAALIGSAGDATDDLVFDAEIVIGSAHADEIASYTNVANTIFGLDGDDSLRGGSLADTLTGGRGADTLHGGSTLAADGRDRVLYRNSDAGVTVNLALGTGAGGEAAGDVFIEIEDAELSDYGDVFIGNDRANQVLARDGDDTLTGGDGADTMDGGAGRDVWTFENVTAAVGVTAGAGDATLNGQAGEAAGDLVTNIEAIIGSAFNDSLEGNAARSTDIQGRDGNDIIAGGTDVDTLSGNTGNDTLEGRGGNDILTGGTGNDSVDGGDGNDSLLGNEGADTLRGGAGEDTVNGGAENDTVTGGDGNDQLTGDIGNDTLAGDGGNDTILGGADDDSLLGGAGADFIDGGSGQDTVDGGAGNDTIHGQFNAIDTDNASLRGGEGDDQIFGDSGADTLFGDADQDLLDAGAGADRVDGGAGSDTIRGGANGAINGDTLTGGTGNDLFEDQLSDFTGDLFTDFSFGDRILFKSTFITDDMLSTRSVGANTALDIDTDGDGTANATLLFTGTVGGTFFSTTDATRTSSFIELSIGPQFGIPTIGNDRIIGTQSGDGIDALAGDDDVVGLAGDDTLFGDDGNDTLDGGLGNDSLTGGAGQDRLRGQAGADTLAGDAGDDFLDGDGDADLLSGGDGNDSLRGGAGADELNGDAGNDTIRGGGEADSVRGGAGVDSLVGEDGNDTLDGGADNDRIDGGAGQDVITDILGANNISGGTGNDTITTGDGNDFVDGGQGEDLVNAGAGSDTLLGDGNDTLNAGDGNDDLRLSGSQSNFVDAGAGDDTIRGSAGDVISTGAGRDVIDAGLVSLRITDFGFEDRILISRVLTTDDFTVSTDGIFTSVTYDVDGNGVADAILTLDGVLTGFVAAQISSSTTAIFTPQVNLVGTPNDDNGLEGGFPALVGTSSADNIDGLAGNDLIAGNGGDDTLLGGVGADTLDGGAGDDSLDGGADADILEGGAGQDTLSGGTGADTIRAGTEDDHVRSGSDNDRAFGEAGDDTLEGEDGNDDLNGDSGADRLNGGAGSDTLRGGADGDSLDGGTENDLLIGEAGNDTLDGGAGGDTLNGGDGNDLVTDLQDTNRFDGGNGDDTIIAGAGHDTIDGSFGGDLINAGAGDDRVAGGVSGFDTIFGEDGDDFLTVTSSSSNSTDRHIVDGGAGNDTLSAFRQAELTGGIGTDQFQLRQDSIVEITDFAVGEQIIISNTVATASFGITNDGLVTTISVDANDNGVEETFITLTGVYSGFTAIVGSGTLTLVIPAVTLNGTPNDDNGVDPAFPILNGSAVGDLIDGLAGNDIINGNDGADTLIGGLGTDTISGGAGDDLANLGQGADFATGGNGDDIFEGGTENDTIFGDTGNDTLRGDDGNDSLRGGADADEIFAGLGNDTVNGDSGDDNIDGQDGNDFVDGGDGDDVILGGAGRDTVRGQDGNDTLDGGADNDQLSGSSGNDVLTDLLGNNTLSGGDGSDTLTAGDGDDSLAANFGLDYAAAGAGNDTITSDDGGDTLFGEGGDDVISYRGSSSTQPTVIANGGDGDDTLVGSGRVQMTGGDGADQFYFNSSATADSVITDFTAIDLVRLFGTITDEDITTSQVVGGIELRVDRTQNGVADFVFTILGTQVGVFSAALPDVSSSSGTTLLQLRPTAGSGIASGADDEVVGTTSANIIDGLEGNDTIIGLAGNDTLNGAAGADLIEAGLGDDLADGGAEDDYIRGHGGNDTLIGGAGDDTLEGNAGADSLSGDGGRDTLRGDQGNDILAGGDNNDSLFGDAGDDILQGDEGNDTLTGGDGADTLDGGDGADRLTGENGNDQIADLSGDNTVSAGQGDDFVQTGNGADDISAGGGSDTIFGGAGNDTIRQTLGSGLSQLFGEDGNDLIDTDSSGDTLNGGAGNDTLNVGFTGNQTLTGGIGSDAFVITRRLSDILITDLSLGDRIVIIGTRLTSEQVTFTEVASETFVSIDADLNGVEDGRFRLSGTLADDLVVRAVDTTTTEIRLADPLGEGTPSAVNDTLIGTGAADTLDGLGGADVIIGRAGDDRLVGGTESDTLEGGSGDDTLEGGSEDDLLQGGSGADVLNGGTQNDTLIGGTGDDQLAGGDGTDSILGGAGNDSSAGGDQNDTVRGEAGNDTLGGDAGNDLVDGGDGADSLDGGADNDTVVGGDGDDVIVDLLGDNRIQDDAGNDTVTTGAGRDFLIGGSGDDLMTAGLGNDTVSTNGNDTVFAGDGNDSITAQTGFADLIGGTGADTIAISIGSTDHAVIIADGDGQDLVTGFAVGQNSRGFVDLRGVASVTSFADIIAAANQLGADTVLTFTGGQTITLRNVTAAALRETDFRWSTDDLNSVGSLSDEALSGVNGNDTLDGANGNDTLLGGRGNDSLIGGAGADSIEGDVSILRQGADTIDGGEGNDTIVAGGGDNVVQGGEGNDSITALGGADVIDGGLGDDSIRTGSGADSVAGSDGNDTISAENDNDTLDGGAGDDSLSGGSGDDLIEDLTGNNRLNGENGNDTLTAGAGADTLSGGNQDDLLTAGEGNDSLDGGDGTDTLFGGSGNDTLRVTGTTGADSLSGGDGDDQLSVSGSATMSGGAGTDLFTTFSTTRGEIVIDDFELGETLRLGNAVADSDVVQSLVGGNTLLEIDVNDDQITDILITLVGISDPLIFLPSVASTDIFRAPVNLIGTPDNDLGRGVTPLALSGTASGDVLDGLSGNDIIAGHAGADTLLGQAGLDTIFGGDDDDSIDGGADNDLLDGGRGTDSVFGGDGSDTLNGSDGADALVGGAGADRANGGDGNDDIRGDDGNDILAGDAGADTLSGGLGNDNLGGDDGDDLLIDDQGRDSLSGDNGNDTLDAGADNDFLDGGAGDDSLIGGDGDDLLRTGTGLDSVSAGDGNDTIEAAVNVAELKTLDGGAGDDVIRVDREAMVATGTGSDLVEIRTSGSTASLGVRITDFSNADTLRFSFLGFDETQVSAFDNGAATTLEIDTNADGTLEGRVVLDGLFDSFTIVRFNNSTTITAVGSNPPVAASDTAITDQDTTVSIDALSNDGGDGLLITSLDARPVVDGEAIILLTGSVVQLVAGQIAFTPSATYRALAVGQTADETFSYQITDSSGRSVTGEVIVSVSGLNDAPVAGPDTATVSESGSVVINVLSNDTDLDVGDTISIGVLDTSATLGMVSDNGDGTLTYNPAGAFDGLDDGEVAFDTFVYAITDASGATSSASVTVAVTGVGTAPTIIGTAGKDTLSGTAGNDIIDGGLGNDSLIGRDGDDSIIGGLGADIMRGQEGNDTLDGGDSNDLLRGDNGNDLLLGGAGIDDLRGGFGMDTLDGGLGNDVVRGEGDDDLITDLEGNNILTGDAGNDTVTAGDGVDNIRGGVGLDLIDAGGGNDSAVGGRDDDTINGGDGDDSLYGEQHNDLLRGEAGNDRLDGAIGDDTLEGGEGNDRLIGNAGIDVLDGGSGDDRIDAGGGDDLATGGAGADFIRGGAGNDTIVGGVGNDTVDGGQDNDTFVFAFGEGADRIDNFQQFGDDNVDISGFGPAFDTAAEVLAAAFQVGSNVVIDFGGGDSLTLGRTTLGSLTVDDFIVS